MSLSRDWRPVSSHESFYTGGAITWHEATESIFGLASECVIMYRDGHVVGKLEEEGDGILTFAVNPSGSAVITSHRSTLLRHWEDVSLGSGSGFTLSPSPEEPEEGNPKQHARSNTQNTREPKWRAIKSWKGHETGIVSDLSFDSKGHFFASGGLDKVAKVWDFDGRFVTHNFHGHESMITHVRFHPTKLHLISISEDAEIRIWDLHRNGCLASLKDHMSKISSLDFHISVSKDDEEDNVFMVTGGRDAIVNVWNMNECKLQTMIPAFESVEGVVCFASEQREFNILTVGDKGILQVWDGRSRKKVEHAMSPHGLKGVIRRAFKARYKGKQDVLVTIGEDRHMIMWTLDLRVVARFMTHCDSIVTCRFAGPEHALVVVNDETPFLMRAADDFRIDAVLQGHREPILAADTRKEDNTVCTGGKDHEIRVWNGRGETKFLLKGHAGDVTSVLFPQKRRDLILSGSADKTIKLWVLPDKKEKKKGTEKNQQQKETHATEGSSSSSSSSGAVIVDVAKITRVAHTKDVTCLAMAPNDKLCASGSLDKVIKIFTFPELEVLGECSGHRRGIWSVQFSARDKVLLSASGDGTVRLWNLADYSAIKAFEGHTGAVLQAHFLPNNMQIMSAGSDGILKLWNIRTTDCVKSFEKHQDKVWGLHLDEVRAAADGGGKHRMLSGGDALILWEDCTEEVTNEEDALAADRMIKDAQIASCLQKKNYASALTLALELGKLGQLKSAIETWAMEGMTKRSSEHTQQGGEEEGKKEEGEGESGIMMATSMMKDWVVSLTPELREKLVKDVLVKWITNRRTAQMANVLLRYCLPLIDVKMEGFNLVTDAFAAYGDRHLQRWDQICQQTFLVDLLLQSTFQTLPQAAVDTARVLFENADLSPRTGGASKATINTLTSASEGGKGAHQKGDAAQQSGGSGNKKKKNKKNAGAGAGAGEGKALVFESVVVQEEEEEKSDDRVVNDAPKKKRKKKQSKCNTIEAEEEKKRVSGRVHREENKENEKVGDAEDNNDVTMIIKSGGKTSDGKSKKRKRSRVETEDGPNAADAAMISIKDEEVGGKASGVLVELVAQEELDNSSSNVGRKKKKAKVEEAELAAEVEKKAAELVHSGSTSMKKKKSKVNRAKQEVETKSEEKDQVNNSMKKKKNKNKK